tara:strand:- start:12001 stop:12615 length:615 start_codon:yes stop_codon:yes gene_type:complete
MKTDTPSTPAPESHVLPPVVTGQMEIGPDVTAADMGVNTEPAEDDIGPYEQALRDAVEPFLDWLEQREEGAHIKEVREGLIGVEDVIPDDHVVLGAHPRGHKDQGVLTVGHFRRLQAAYDGKAAPAPQPNVEADPSETVDKARAWDAAQKSYRKGRLHALEEAAKIAETGDYYGQFQTAGDERRAKAIAERIRALATTEGSDNG